MSATTRWSRERGALWTCVRVRWWHARRPQRRFRDPTTSHARALLRRLAYVHYFANGSIAPVAITAEGVGSHDAALRIEAEEYASLAGGAFKRHAADGRFGVQLPQAGASVSFTHVRNVPLNGSLRLAAVNDGVAAATVVVRLGDAESGPELCRGTVGRGGHVDAGAAPLVECEASAAWRDGSLDVPRDVDVHVVVGGDPGLSLWLDALQFQ